MGHIQPQNTRPAKRALATAAPTRMRLKVQTPTASRIRARAAPNSCIDQRIFVYKQVTSLSIYTPTGTSIVGTVMVVKAGHRHYRGGSLEGR
jgi:hypothetical protein